MSTVEGEGGDSDSFFSWGWNYKINSCIAKIFRRIPWRRAWQPTPSTLAWEIPWTKEPGVAETWTWLKWLSTQTSSARLMNSSSKSWPVDRGSHRSGIQRKTHVRYRYESTSEAWFHPWCWLLWDISVSFKEWKGGFYNLNELKLLQILPDIYFYFSWTSLA